MRAEDKSAAEALVREFKLERVLNQGASTAPFFTAPMSSA